MPVDPLAAFALTLAVSIGGVAYVLKMAGIEARNRVKAPDRRTR